VIDVQAWVLDDTGATGIKATAGVVTSAAIVMVAVFSIFATLGQQPVLLADNGLIDHTDRVLSPAPRTSPTQH
jgi:hypothetical protein